MKRSHTGHLFAVVLVSTVLVPGDQPARAQSEEPKAGRPRAVAPGEADCLQFARAVEAAVAKQDVSALNSLIDWEQLLRQATAVKAESPAVAKLRGEFIAGVMKALNENLQSFAGQTVAVVARGGDYRLLRTRMVDGRQSALFRLVLPEGGGLNYHEYLLERRPGGRVQAVDVYVFFTGERLSDSFRRIYLPVAADASRTLLERLTRAESDLVRHIDAFAEMANGVNAGKFTEALDIYKKLPPSLQADKNFLVLRLRAAQRIGEEEYEEAIEAFRHHYSDDPAVDFISIDGYALRGEFSKAAEAIERVVKAVGGDPHLSLSRANMQILANDLQGARKSAERALRDDPNLADAYGPLLLVALRQRDYRRTRVLLEELERKFGTEVGDLAANPEYAGFVESAEYQNWLDREQPDPARR